MKKLLIIPFLFLSLLSFTQPYTYYIRADGNDSNTGLDTTTSTAWATWQKGFNEAEAGDTVYFMDRGGIYYLGASEKAQLRPPLGYGDSGTYENPIHFYNYPDESPILDAINRTGTAPDEAVDIRNTTYVKFRGLTVRNLQMHNDYPTETDDWIGQFYVAEVGVCWFDQIVSYNSGGYGIYMRTFDTLVVTNCDSYGHADTLRSQPGNRSDGFVFGSGTTTPDQENKLTAYGNRSWNNSDDGFEFSPPCQLDVHDNWAFCNGRMSHGAGVGFKQGNAYLQTISTRVFYRNIATHNLGVGFIEQNLYTDSLGPVGAYYNNLAVYARWGFGRSAGFYEPDNYPDATNTVYKNNITYASTFGSYFDQMYLPISITGDPFVNVLSSHNTWAYKESAPNWEYNDTISWAYSSKESQWISLPDSATTFSVLSAARGEDGSLPDIGNYYKLASTSDLIDAGVDVGLSYNGSAPDLGPFEYGINHCDTITVITVALDSTATDTIGSNTGAAYISVSGGTYGTSYTYYWTPGGYTTQNIAGVAGRSYTVVATDDSSCTGNRNVFISSISPESNDLTLDSISVTTPSTLTASDTTIFHITGTGNKAYYLNGESNVTDSLFILSAPGLYMLECKTDNDSIRYQKSSNRIYLSGTIYGGLPEGVKTY